MVRANLPLQLLLLLVLGALGLSPAHAGTWTALAHRTPSISPNGNPTLMLLLSDGTVMVQNDPTGGGGTNWFKLTPATNGSYINGTWSNLPPMNYSRAGCSSDVMTNGQVFFAGGEYGTGGTNSEVYDPVSNVWTLVTVPTNLLDPSQLNKSFSDSISIMLPNGNVMVAPVSGQYAHETMIYNFASNTFVAGPNLRSSSQDEASWVKLPDDSILTIDPFSTNSERYIPSQNKWIADAHVPVALYDGIGELGAGFLLPNGKAFFLGGTGHTAIYTPSGTTNAGSWTAAADMPIIGTNAQGCPDAPAAMMVNGKILVSTGVAGTYNGPIYFFEYDYTSNSFTQINGPTGGTNFGAAPYYTKMLDLPDGTVLWNWGQPQMYVYKPDGLPLTVGKPVINSIVGNADGSYHLTGLGLNGISAGTAYGDDAQMDSNYPLVRITNGTSVYYARTFNWTSTSVMTSNKVVSTEFALPASLPAGTHTLVVVANGIASDPVLFTTPLTAPKITSLTWSGADLVINATNGLAGRTYYTLAGTNISTPFSQWMPLATNVLGVNGSFSITLTNAANAGNTQAYFVLKAQ